MKNLALENYGVDTLSFEEMLCIDGGNFWNTLGVICAFVLVAAAIYVTGGLAAVILA